MPAGFELNSDSTAPAKLSTQSVSPRLLQAAISGLMAASALGCSADKDDSKADSVKQDLSDEELRAVCSDMIAAAKGSATEKATAEASKNKSDCEAPDLESLCAERVKEAEKSNAPDIDKLCKEKVNEAVMAAKPDSKALCADMVKEAEVKASTPKTREEKTISAEQKEFTFTELTKMCDSRGGYVQVHGACGGHNACQGFSYGDWGPGAAMLSEHSCSGANSCAGLSCVVLPKETRKDMDGAALYDVLFADTEPSSCSNCHAPHVDDKPELDKFTVYVLEGSTRTESNWLERSAAEQERVVAFGAHGVLSNGVAMENMAAYNRVLSRTEVERVVAHLRTLKPVIKVMKTKDPMQSM